MTCSDCGASTPRRGHNQLYCPACSQVRDLKRKRLWQAEKGHKLTPAELKDRWRGNHSARHAAGMQHAEGRTIGWMEDPAPDMAWIVRLAIPFDYAISKNHIWTTTRDGHVFLRGEHRHMRTDIVWKFKQALSGYVVKQNRLWLDVLVQKPDHKGDAVNVLDGICDALKVATGLDDRWYSIRRLDWEVVKSDPQIYVGIGQEEVDDVQVCAYCGRLLAFEAFGRNRSNKTGRARTCFDCTRVANSIKKKGTA